MAGNKQIKYSFIVLLEEKQQDFSQFVINLYNLFERRGESFEILIVVNGTGGFLRNEIRKVQAFNSKIKVLKKVMGRSLRSADPTNR